MTEQTKTTDTDKRIAADFVIALLQHRKDVIKYPTTRVDNAVQELAELYLEMLEKVKAS